MKLKPIAYKFTRADTKKIKDLGYTIHIIGPASFEKFMRTEFANFNLVLLLEELESTFAPTTTLNISRNLYVSKSPPSLRILFVNDFKTEDEAVVFDRKFEKKSKKTEINHSYCIIPAAHQKKGLIKKGFQASLQQYINIGAGCIKVHAGLSGGGHVWARHGFVATDKKEVEVILEDARKKLPATDFAPVEHIFSKYYKDHPGGNAFPMILWTNLPGMKDVLRGADWHGEIDLKNSNQFSNFMSYVFRN